MRFGLLLANQHPPGESVFDRFRETIEQVRLARSLEFDPIVFGQHFLAPEFQMLQPGIAAARLAAEAGTSRIGITIYLLPLLNPVAVAEEAATLDVVTGGRFIFGIGLGYREVEDRAFGVGRGERVGRLVEHLAVIRRLWAGEPVTFEAPHCRLVEARTGIRPLQQPHPPIWVAASRCSIRWRWRRRRRPSTWSRVAGSSSGSASATVRWKIARPHLERKYQAYVAWGQHRVLPRGDDMTQAFDDLVRDRFILGDPAECAAEIRRCVERTGATTMIFRVHWPGMPQEAVTGAMRLLAEEVRPRV